jgi:putative copper export protein
MKTIPTYVHGILDYIIGIALLIAPNLFGFAHLGGAPVMVARWVGIIVLIQALFTNYELGLFKVLSMRTHLRMDYILSIFLAISPWLFRFNTQPGNVWLPHVIVGVLAFLLALMTQTEPRRVPVRTAA